MIAYCVVLFFVATLFAVVSTRIYKGKTNLIHDYHQTNVTDKASYGRAFGKAMGIPTGTMVLSGTIALLGDSAPIVWAALSVLAVGFVIGFVCIFRVQKKFNGGVFG